MKTKIKIRVNLAVCLLALVGTVSADVTAEISGGITSAKFTNNTNQAWRLGGVRYQTSGGTWQSIDNWLFSQGHIVLRQGEAGQQPNETEVYYKSTAPSDNAALLRAGSTHGISHVWSHPNHSSLVPKDANNLELLLKTGSPGIPDEPISYPPITVDEARELSNHPDFYRESYRYENYDSLGSNGGKYSGGFMDTYFEQTQLQFVIPKGNQIRDAAAMRGDGAPAYYMALGMGQEYLNVDAQWMFAMGAKESWSGTQVNYGDTWNGQNIMWSTGNQAVGSGNYTSWHVEDMSGNDRALNYPHLFPKFQSALSTARDVTTLLTILQTEGLVPAGSQARTALLDYYVGGYDARTSPRSINGLFVSASFQYVNYDVLAYSTDICWKYALANAKDPYMGLSAMVAAYNCGMWGEISKIKGHLNDANVGNTINNSNARTLFCAGNHGNYREEILQVSQALIDASKDFTLGSGANSEVIDFKITLDQLRSMFFGTGGSVNSQGDGGILLHYYDPAAGKDVSAIRQKIWNSLTEVFDVLKGRALTADANTISYRYDFLTAIRTVKAELPYERRFVAAGDASTLVPGNSTQGCASETGGVVDEIYPRAAITITPDENICVVKVDMTDNVQCKQVKWTIDYSWGIWNNATMNESTPSTSNSFIFEISVEMADAFKDRGDGSGEFVWIMAEDASGNSVVKKAEIRFIKEFKRPSPKSAAVFDTIGNGAPNLLRAVIIRNDLGNLTNAAYSWKWNSMASPIKPIPAGDISANRDTLFVNISSTDGSGSGMLYMEYDSIDYEKQTEDPNYKPTKVKDSVAIIDSCGPAIKGFAEFTARSIGDASKPDTLKVAFTEDIIGEKGGVVQLVFAKDDKGNSPLEISATLVKKEGNVYVFLYDSEQIGKYVDDKFALSYTHVSIKSGGGITDAAGNPPLENNRWALISDFSASLNWIDLKITNAEFYSNASPADGYVDSIKLDFTLDYGSFGKFDDFVNDIKNIVLEKLVLPTSREFYPIDANDFKIVGENSIEIRVQQDKSKVKAKTSVDKEDNISAEAKIRSENIDTVGIMIDARDLTPKDFIAPIIIEGFFAVKRIQSEDDEIIDTLTIVFSEDVSGEIKSDMIRAFDLSNGGTEYEIAFEPLHANGNTVTFEVKSNCGNTFPEIGDSIRIEYGIRDKFGNEQDARTIWAKLTVGRSEPSYSVDIYPNPFNPNKTTFDEQNLIIEVRPIGNRCGNSELPKGMSGSAIIIDKLGNKIFNKNFEDNNNGSLIWKWDGKNSRGRNVGSGLYQAIIQIIDDEGSKKTILRKVGIKN